MELIDYTLDTIEKFDTYIEFYYNKMIENVFNRKTYQILLYRDRQYNNFWNGYFHQDMKLWKRVSIQHYENELDFNRYEYKYRVYNNYIGVY